MLTAMQIIESIQKTCYKRVGINPSDIRETFIALAIESYRRQKEAGTDGPDIEAFRDDLERSAKGQETQNLTKFQDPITIAQLLDCWRLIQEGNPDEALQNKYDSNASASNVVLATAPTGNLNARAIQGEDGSKGILFE